MSGTPAPHTLALTAAGKRLADALVKAEIIFESGGVYDPFFETLKVDELNTAAAHLFPAGEEAGLREAAKLALDVLTSQVAEASKCGDPNYECPMQDIHGPDDDHLIARSALIAALASPQPAVEGPIAAGVEPERISELLAEYRGYQADCPLGRVYGTATVGEFVSFLHALTPQADPKPTVPGNDAGMRAALKIATDALTRFAIGRPCSPLGHSEHASTVLEKMRAVLAPQTGSAGEDPKTPNAGVVPRIPECPSQKYETIAEWVNRNIDLVRWLENNNKAIRSALRRLAQPAPVGEDETRVREAGAVDPALYWMKKWGDLMVAYDALAAHQPPKAETPAGATAYVPDDLTGVNRLEWIIGYYGPELPIGLADRLWDLAQDWRAALSAAPAARPGDGVEASEIVALLAEKKPSIETSGDFVGLTFDMSGEARQFANLLAKAAISPAAAPAADGGRAQQKQDAFDEADRDFDEGLMPGGFN